MAIMSSFFLLDTSPKSILVALDAMVAKAAAVLIAGTAAHLTDEHGTLVFPHTSRWLDNDYASMMNEAFEGPFEDYLNQCEILIDECLGTFVYAENIRQGKALAAVLGTMEWTEANRCRGIWNDEICPHSTAPHRKIKNIIHELRSSMMVNRPVRISNPDPDVRREMGADLPRNCPVRERTADGDPAGRCCFWLGEDGNTCPRHGDVSNESWLAFPRKDSAA